MTSRRRPDPPRVVGFRAEPELLDAFLAGEPAGASQRRGSPGNDPAARLLAGPAGAWPADRCRWRNFLAFDGARPAGRLTAMVNPDLVDDNGRPFGLLGFFAVDGVAEVDVGEKDVSEDGVAQDNVAVGHAGAAGVGAHDRALALAGALVAAAGAWLAEDAARPATVLAPVAFDAWHDYRFRTSGFEHPPFPGEPANPPAYPALFEALGFRPVIRHVTKTVPAPAELAKLWEPHRRRALARGFTFQTVDRAALPAALAAIHRLSADLFGGLRFFTPLPLAEFLNLYAGIGDRYSPDDLVLAADPSGAIAGVAFGFEQPDDPGTIAFKSFAVCRRWRNTGLAPALACAFYRRRLASGARCIEHCLMADGAGASRFDRGQGEVTRRYALFGRELG